MGILVRKKNANDPPLLYQDPPRGGFSSLLLFEIAWQTGAYSGIKRGGGAIPGFGRGGANQTGGMTNPQATNRPKIWKINLLKKISGGGA